MTDISTVAGLHDISGRYQHLAYNRIYALMGWRKQAILDAARERLIGGLESFGTDMFTWSDALCTQNIIEELADGINYAIPMEMKR